MYADYQALFARYSFRAYNPLELTRNIVFAKLNANRFARVRKGARASEAALAQAPKASACSRSLLPTGEQKRIHSPSILRDTSREILRLRFLSSLRGFLFNAARPYKNLAVAAAVSAADARENISVQSNARFRGNFQFAQSCETVTGFRCVRDFKVRRQGNRRARRLRLVRHMAIFLLFYL